MRSRIIASGVAFALAVLVAITLHELAHAVVGAAQGGSPELFGFSVDQGRQSTQEQTVSALAGPVFSLVSGLVALAVPLDRASPFWRLTWLWFGLASVQSFNAYLITGPFADAGDIGRVWALSGVGPVVPWLGFVLGWALTVVLGRFAAARFGRLVSAGERVGVELPAFGVYGWLAGTAIGVVLSLGLLGAGEVSSEVALFSALGLMASGVCVAFLGLFRTRAAATSGAGPAGDWPLPVLGAGVLIVVVIARQLLLGRGLGL